MEFSGNHRHRKPDNISMNDASVTNVARILVTAFSSVKRFRESFCSFCMFFTEKWPHKGGH
jgi:hypothetical protein